MSSTDQIKLVSYLNAGGSVYMEGANVAYFHNNTEFWNLFGADFIHWGATDAVYLVNGIDGSLSEDLAMIYAGGVNAHYYMDEIEESDGVLYLSDEDDKGRGVYYNNGNYRTVCTSPVIGAYGMGEGLSFGAFLMGQYVDFLRGELTDLDDIVIPAGSPLLGHNYPNPFNPTTTIEYSIPTEDHVRLEVFNLKGEKVTVLIDDVREAGSHSVIWNGTDDTGKSAASGIYFYKLKTGRYTSTKKMILMK